MNNTNNTPQIIVKQIKFPVTTYQFLWVIWLGGLVLMGAYNAFGWEENQMKMCQESFMKATNEIVQYNIDNPKYKIELPKYNCTTNLNATGGIAPEPPEKSYNQVNLWSNMEILYDKICKKQINSPLCKDKELLGRLYSITESRLPWKNMFPILVGITNAESSLWINFANDKVGGKCDGRNNWGGTKYQILDDNSRVYKRSLNWFEYSNSVDQYGCNLYPFESIEEFWITKVNGMRFWYKSCLESLKPIRCISYSYVGNPKVAEQSWINNVSSFLNN